MDFKGQETKRVVGWVGLGLILIGNALFLNYCAFRGFFFYDFGVFLDAAWRVFRGQQVYIDFHYHVGAVHLFMLASLFHLFGFGKAAILVHLVVVSSAVVVGTYYIARKKASLFLALLAAALSAACYYTNRPHPWYDQSAYLWGVLATWWFVARFPAKSARDAFWVGLGCGVGVALSLLTKTNIGLAYMFSFLAVLLLSREKIASLTGYGLGLVAAAFLTIIMTGAPLAFFDNVFQSYVHVPGAHGGQSDRITRLLAPSYWVNRNFWLVNFYWVPLVIVFINFWRMQKRLIPLLALFGLTVFTAIFSMHTGSERYVSYIPLMGICVALAAVLLSAMDAPPQNGIQALIKHVSVPLLIVFVIVEITFTVRFAYERTHAARHPEIRLPRYRSGDYQLTVGPFKGWRFHETDGQVLDDIVRTISRLPKEDSLLIITNLMIVNALSDRDSYPGLSLSIVANTEPPPGPKLEAARKRILSNPPDWILTHRDPSAAFNPEFDYLNLGDDFLPHYKIKRTWLAYGLLERVKN